MLFQVSPLPANTVDVPATLNVPLVVSVPGPISVTPFNDPPAEAVAVTAAPTPSVPPVAVTVPVMDDAPFSASVPLVSVRPPASAAAPLMVIDPPPTDSTSVAAMLSAPMVNTPVFSVMIALLAVVMLAVSAAPGVTPPTQLAALPKPPPVVSFQEIVAIVAPVILRTRRGPVAGVQGRTSDYILMVKRTLGVRQVKISGRQFIVI